MTGHIFPRSRYGAALLATTLLWAGAASAQSTPAPVMTPSRAVPGTHDCSSFFPDSARRGDESGDVLVSYDVGADGAISHVIVKRSSGYKLLDHAAVACVSTFWRNTPAERDGVKVASAGHLAIIRFALTEAPPTPVAEPPTPVAPPDDSEDSDLVFWIGASGLLVVLVVGGAVLVFRRRKRR